MKKELIEQFIEASIKRSKRDIYENGTHDTTLYVLTKKDGNYSVFESKINQIIDVFDSIKKVVKSMVEIQFMFHKLREDGYELIHMVHTEITNIDKDDDGKVLENGGESLIAYDKNFKTDDCSVKVYAIKREEAVVNNNGEFTLGKPTFVEFG